MVRNATTSSSRHTKRPGMSPRMIMVNTDGVGCSVMARDSAPPRPTMPTMSDTTAGAGPAADTGGGGAPGVEPSGDRLATLPNLITLVRLLCIPVFLYLLFVRDARLGAAILLGVLGATDWVDG